MLWSVYYLFYGSTICCCVLVDCICRRNKLLDKLGFWFQVFLCSLLQLYFQQSQLRDLGPMLPIASMLWPGDYQRHIIGPYVHCNLDLFHFFIWNENENFSMYSLKDWECVMKLLWIIICVPIFFVAKADDTLQL